MQSILSLENKYKGRDIYVVGGGKSVDFYPKSFFDGRIVIGVNQASRVVPCNFIVRKEHATVEGDVPVIASKHKFGSLRMGLNGTEADPRLKTNYYFDHHDNGIAEINTEGLHPNGDKIVVSWSTITSAIHMAAFMGAKSIFLLGHDCATIDGDAVAKGYYDCVDRITPESDYGKWLSGIAPQTTFMREYLRDQYQCSLITLSPFIGLKHEGHKID